MLKINKNVSLALQTIEFLKSEEAPVKTAQIAEKLGTSAAFLEQVMRRLRIAGITRSVRGPGGGSLLNRGQTVSALTVANAFGYAHPAPTQGLQGSLSEALTAAFENTKIEL